LSDEADPLFDCLRANRVFVTPTLSVYPAVARSRGYDELPPELAAQIEGLKRIALRLYRSGVPLLVGTDAASIGPLNIKPGSSLREEMAMLQDAGIPPRDILRMATSNAVSTLGLEVSHGSIEAGKFADFLLTRLDPADDIRNVATAEAVYLNGVAVVVAEQSGIPLR